MWNNIIHYLQHLPNFVWNLLIVAFAVLMGLIIKAILSVFVKRAARHEDFSMTRSIIQRLAPPVTYFLPLLILNFLQDEMRMKLSQQLLFNRALEILITLAVSYMLICIIKVAEDYVYHRYDLKKPNNLRSRKIRTQLQFIRRLSVGIIVLITLCIIFLSFDNLRKLGAGLLTGVGISGIIIGFAAQKSLSNLLAGFQIAFTQPLRLDDVLVVEGEYGRVEEITLTYVVLIIWDERRLILPINYFIEKPFQNWTRTGSQILSAAMIYLDYTVPVEAVRTEFLRLVHNSPLWDKRVSGLQVTNLNERTVELRCLISANTSALSFDLRCYVRENLLNFIQKNYPASLPKTRIEIENAEQKNAASM